MDIFRPYLVITPPPPLHKESFGGVYKNHPVCLFICLSRVNLTLAITFESRHKAFILHMWVHCEKTFLFVPKILTLTLTLTYFRKNLTLAITFEQKEIRLSYYIYGLLVTRPFCSYQKF